jgi:hypothetical protein
MILDNLYWFSYPLKPLYRDGSRGIVEVLHAKYGQASFFRLSGDNLPPKLQGFGGRLDFLIHSPTKRLYSASAALYLGLPPLDMPHTSRMILALP